MSCPGWFVNRFYFLRKQPFLNLGIDILIFLSILLNIGKGALDFIPGRFFVYNNSSAIAVQ